MAPVGPHATDGWRKGANVLVCWAGRERERSTEREAERWREREKDIEAQKELALERSNDLT